MDMSSTNWQKSLIATINQNDSNVNTILSACSQRAEEIANPIVQFEVRPLIERQVQVLDLQGLINIDLYDITQNIVAKITSKITEICVQQCNISDATTRGIGEIFRPELRRQTYPILLDAINNAIYEIATTNTKTQASSELSVGLTSILENTSTIGGLPASKTISRKFKAEFSEKGQQAICAAITEAPTSTKQQTLNISVDEKFVMVTFIKPIDKPGRISKIKFESSIPEIDSQGFETKPEPEKLTPTNFPVKAIKLAREIYSQPVVDVKDFKNLIKMLKKVPDVATNFSSCDGNMQYVDSSGTAQSIPLWNPHSTSDVPKHAKGIKEVLQVLLSQSISTQFGDFIIHHTTPNGNCLFEAIGHFLGYDHARVRAAINEQATIMLDDPNMRHGITEANLQDAQRVTEREGRFGGDNEARIAAIAFNRRVFVFYNTDYEAYQDVNPNLIPQPQGWDQHGNPIDINPQTLVINPGEDIVLYFNIDPSPDASERHIEALIR